MTKQVNYRKLNSEEVKEIERLSNEAKKIISFKQEDTEIIVVKKIKEFVDNLNTNNSELIERYGYELGSLYGEMIKQKYQWEWYYIEKEGESFYCIASNDRRACCAVHNYYYSIINRNKSNNSILLFNMIKQSYPKDWDFTFLW